MAQQKSPASMRKILRASWLMLKDALGATPKISLAWAVIIAVLALLPIAENLLFSRTIDALILAVANGTNVLESSLLLFAIATLSLRILQSLLWAASAALDRVQYFAVSKYFNIKYLAKTSQLDLYHYENPANNDMLTRASESYAWRPQNAANRSMWTFSSLVAVLGSISVIAIFSPLFFGIILLCLIPSIIVSYKQANESWGIWDEDSELRRRFWDVAWYLRDERSLMELRIFGTRNYLFDMVLKFYHQFTDRQKSAAVNKAALESLSTLASTVGLGAFFLYLLNLALAQQITVGDVAFYGTIASSLSNNLNNLVRNFTYTYEDGKYMVDYYDVLELPDNIKSGNITLPKSQKPPHIEYRNVDFSYPGKEEKALNNFNLTIAPGEKIALVGENGAGKSTIVKLLSRFYDPTHGQILVDGVDIKDVQLEDWYAHIGVLFQDFVQYHFLSASNNIGLGNVAAVEDEDRIKHAAKMAEADIFIDKLPKQYQQILSKRYEGGTDLSGGQWQRLALARGFFRDAPVLILDEPTSAIDAKGEAEIFDRLFNMAADKTVLIISHRFSTVRRADKIYVIDAGQVVESGSHAELMQQNGKYAHAFSLQAKGYQN
jgi:ATP-binding cassette subfamily B protein